MRKRAQTLLIFSLIVTFALTLPAQASAQGPQVWSGVCLGSTIENGQDVATIQGLQCVIANLLTIAITGVGFAGFVMIIYGAFRYMISGGNSKGTEAAKNTLTWAVIGLVVALSSFFILNIIAQFTGVDTILNFVIPDSSTGL